MKKNLEVYKVAVINDLLGLALSKINIKAINNPIGQSKFRNLQKATQSFSSFVDEAFTDPVIQEAFGDLCDSINANIDKTFKMFED